MSASDLRSLLKRVVELVMPDLRAYYRVPRKGLVVQAYASDGRYWADVQPLRNDEAVDDREPIIPRVEIPVLWGGPERGVVCPPTPGTLCDITYYDGDPNYPRISNFRWQRNAAPACELGAFIIQADPQTSIKIDAQGNVITIAPGNWTVDIGELASIKAGQVLLDSGDIGLGSGADKAVARVGDQVTCQCSAGSGTGTIVSGSGVVRSA